jgi:hypothetical protein
MPSNLTDASSFDAVTGPLGSDVRNAAAVRAALQPLANRTRYLFDRHTPLADIAALQAITSPADGLVRLVKNYGVFVFDATSVLGESLPWVVAPNAGAGRWLHELYNIPRPREAFQSRPFTASGTWVSPIDGVVLLVGYGNGGTGGGTPVGEASNDRWRSGGGAGGGSLETVRLVEVTKGQSYDVAIAAAAPGVIGAPGQDGEPLLFGRSGEDPLEVFRGGGGGGAGALADGPTFRAFATGGFSIDGVAPLNAYDAPLDVPLPGAFLHGPASGGYGATSNGGPSHAGLANPRGALGGAAGAHGIDVGAARGGGGGGGGGGGPGGPGGAGGAGGTALTGSPGEAGADAAPNSGAGGGGAGAGGRSALSGAPGGACGTGKLTIIWVA